MVEVAGDGNGIYISGTGPGNIIRRNYVHDIIGHDCRSAIRFDDFQWNTLVTENVIWKCTGGGIILKGVNEIVNNIIIACEKPSICVRSPGTFGSIVQRNIYVQFSETNMGFDNSNPFYGGGGRSNLKELSMDSNLFFFMADCDKTESFLEVIKNQLGQDKDSVIGDPWFLNIKTGDFILNDDSPAFKIGFRKIDHWGIRNNIE